MAYSSWSVVFGEQPSAAKWNILGNNDASFNDGTGFGLGVIGSTTLAEDYIRGRYQTGDGTNSAPTDLTMQMGWGFIVGDNTENIDKTVTFPTAFSSAPLVQITFAHSRATAAGSPTGPGWFTTVVTTTAISAGHSSVTTTNFNAVISRSDGGSLASTNNYGFVWQAIGAV